MVCRPLYLAALCCAAAVLLACGNGAATEPTAVASNPGDTPPGTAAVIRPGPLQSYYFEASVKTAAQSQSSDHLVIESWFNAPDQTRWELHSSLDDTYKRILLVDGEEQWFYEPGTNTFTHGRNAESIKALNGKPYPLPATYQLGLLAAAQQGKPVGSDTYLGRAVDIYESATAEVKTTSWVDHEYGVTLRQQVQSTDPNLISFEAKVEKIQYNPRFSSQTFAFVPPAGAKEGTAGRPGATPAASRGALNIPAGMPSPSYIPAGYRLDSSSQSATAGVTSYIERHLINDSGASLALKEQYRPGGLPDYLKGGSEVTVGAGTAYLTRGGGEVTLLLYRNDVIVTVTASALSVDELRKMLEFLE